MADPPVYQDTTEADRGKEASCCVWWRHLTFQRFAVKVLELVLSFIAFICEELVEHCEQCSGLYFFEFVSCTAFLLCIVVIVVYCTKLSEKIVLKRLKHLDLWFTAIVGIFFILASITFVSTKSGSNLENTSVAFGFLASFMFVADFALLWWKEQARFLKTPQREEQVPSQPPENVALNNQQSET